MKQKLKRFMAGFMAMLTLVGTLFTNGTTAFAASPQANIAFWNASVKNSGEVSELKPGFNHGKILYSILDGNSAYCMNFGLRADGGQLMNSYDDASTSMSAQQRKLLSYCLYYGFNSTQKAAPSNSQCDEYIATQAMVWVIVADIFGTGSGDSAARKLCNTAPSPDSSYSYYERLRDNISSSYNATLPSFASRRTSEAPTYELKWNDGSQRFETTLSDSNGVLSDFDFGISGYSVDKNGNSITISSTSVNTTATTGTFTSNAGKVETTSSCVFWLTGKSGYQEFISERPTADPIKAYIKVKTENIGYGELTKTDESSGVKLSGAVYGIYSDSGCTNRVQTMTTDGNGYAKSAALVAGTYYVKEITAPKGYVLSGKVHTLNGGLTSYKYKAEISVVVRKEDLYIVGLELAKGEYREFPNVEYSQYYHLHFNNVDEKRRKLMLTVQTIGDGIAQIENDISNPAQKIDDMYFRKKNSCITITNIAFIISEAARFEFVRDTVKRIYGYLSNDEITQIYLNPKSSGRWYNYRPYYRDLLDHYSKIAIASNKGEKNLHNEMLTVDECREYYSDTVKFPDDYPNLEDLRKIGLIERK